MILISLCLDRVNDVEILGNRLGKIEEALIRCLSAVERSQTPSNATARQSSVIPSDDSSHPDPNDSAPTDGNTLTDASLETNAEACNDPTFPGSTPIASFYTEAQAACDRLRSVVPFASPDSQHSPASPDFIPDRTGSLQSRLQEVGELFEKFARESPVMSIPESDGLLPSLPPRALVETCLETYFACLSPFLPLYSRQSVMAAIDEQYGPRVNSPDPAWVISFNNILLQTLDARYSAATRAGSITHNLLEEELIKSLLLNYRRGYNNFERLLRPQLANVQALLSMVGRPFFMHGIFTVLPAQALIALKYFSLATFETVFAQACQLAKSIGLHQSSPDSENAEQKDLWWSLFIIDESLPIVCVTFPCSRRNRSTHLSWPASLACFRRMTAGCRSQWPSRSISHGINVRHTSLWPGSKKTSTNVSTRRKPLTRAASTSVVKLSRSTEHWMTGKSSTNTSSLLQAP